MAYSWQESVKPAGTQDIQCDIEYLDKSYIHVYLDGAETTAFTWTSSTNIRLNSPLSAETVVLLIRKTEREYLYIEFASGAPFVEGNVDTQNTQFLHLAQELVEGRSIEGFYGDINMRRYRITNLGDPVDARDAANKQYVDAGDARLDQRIDAEHAAWVAAVANEAAIRKAADDALDVRTTNLEQTYFNANTNSFPWWTVLTADTDTVTPGMPFTKAKVRINGVTQTAGYSYTVNAGVVKFAEVLPAGTLVDMTIGIDTEADTSAVSTILGLFTAPRGADLSGYRRNKLSASVGDKRWTVSVASDGRMLFSYSTDVSGTTAPTDYGYFTPSGDFFATRYLTAGNRLFIGSGTDTTTKGISWQFSSTVVAAIDVDSVGRIYLKPVTATGNQWSIGSTQILPSVTATLDIGSSTFTVKNITLQNAPVVISDERRKDVVSPVSANDALMRAWGKLDFFLFYMKESQRVKGEFARMHAGLIAQHVRDALVSEGLSIDDYAFINHSEERWAVEYDEVGYKPVGTDTFGLTLDASGYIVLDPDIDTVVDGELVRDVYSLRMEECLVVEMAYQRWLRQQEV